MQKKSVRRAVKKKNLFEEITPHTPQMMARKSFDSIPKLGVDH